MMGENKKKSLDFTDQIFKNTMLERWILQADETDYFGRPVKETFKFVNPLFFLVQIGDEFSGTNYERPEEYGYGDKYLMLFGRQNYSPRSSIGDIFPFTYKPSDFANSPYNVKPRTSRQMTDTEIKNQDARINTASEEEVDYVTFVEQQEKRLETDDPRISGIYDKTSPNAYIQNELGSTDGGTIVNYQMTAEEAYMINRKKGEFVYDLISYEATNKLGEKISNFDKLKNLDKDLFKSLMDELYQLGRNIAVRNNIPDFTTTNQKWLNDRIINSLTKCKQLFQAYDMVWPEGNNEFNINRILPDLKNKVDGAVLDGEFKFK
jgi:predicted transcriptional regulator